MSKREKSIPDQPLVTMALFAYNQEKFIEEAVQSVLSQTYSPLEIILSDDCSNDDTFRVMQEMASAYKGPHEIVLNHNVENLGVGGHVNRVMEIAKGEFVVAAAGDDISMPDRTVNIVNHFISHKECCSVYSNMIVLDEEGRPQNPWKQSAWVPPGASLLEICRNGVYVFGCTHAWRRKIFDIYGPIDPKVVHEDIVIPFRSALTGTIDYLDEKLVYYRRHSSNVWQSQTELNNSESSREYKIMHANGSVAVKTTMLKDFIHFLSVNNRDVENSKSEIAELQDGVLRAKLDRDMLDCSTRNECILLLFNTGVRVVGLGRYILLSLKILFPKLYLWCLRTKTTITK